MSILSTYVDAYGGGSGVQIFGSLARTVSRCVGLQAELRAIFCLRFQLQARTLNPRPRHQTLNPTPESSTPKPSPHSTPLYTKVFAGSRELRGKVRFKAFWTET